jgi:hypothetical protein
MVLLGKDILGGKWQNSFLSTSVIYDSCVKISSQFTGAASKKHKDPTTLLCRNVICENAAVSLAP